MDKNRINYLLKNPTDSGPDDLIQLQHEISRYPFAQFLHVLNAKIKHLTQDEDKNQKLTTAAIYSSDRSILKKVILDKEYMDHHEELVPFQDLPTFELEDPIYHEQGLDDSLEANDSATIFDEVLKNLERLKSLRKQFQFLELEDEPAPARFSVEEKEKKSEKKKKKTTPKINKTVAVTNIDVKKEEAKKRKLDEILEKDEKIDIQVNEYFLRELEEKKEEKDKEPSKKNFVQSEIIEKFIEEQPSIGSLKNEIEKSQDEINRDLSERSTNFGDDLVSENLAVILLKQGKRERAIDIYKKLIWKLPQKKAYFAARIEEIKK